MIERGIGIREAEAVIVQGNIIKEYPEDHPHPSCLMLGKNAKSQALHVVCGVSEDTLWLITAYYPDPDEWEPDYKTRRRQMK